MDSAPSEAIELLQWDSEHFGFSVARVHNPVGPERMRAAVDAAEGCGVRCLTALVDADQIETIGVAEDLGFRCYDVRVELDRQIEGPQGSPGVLGLRVATECDLPNLEPIADRRFSISRFAADPHFPDVLVGRLYVEWLRRGLRTESRVLLVTSELEGFVVCCLERNGGLGTIELIAVAPEAEGNGFGDRLVRGAEALFADAGLKRARVVTQGRNLSAQRLYQRHGYRTAGVALWFHRWAPSR